MTRRADALADTLLQGANTLADLAASLTDAEWQVRVPRDGRTVGVIVHHVATMYPLEIELARAVGEVLAPWQELTERTLGRLVAAHPLGALLPVPVPGLARLAMAAVLGLELLSVPDGHDPATLRGTSSR